jgi:hypothetical protein
MSRLVIALPMLVFGTIGCGDLEPIEPWDCCPKKDVFESPGGDLTLEVGNRALFCAIPPLPRPDPASVLSSLSRLLLIEGTYEIPAESGEYPVRLPLCIKLPDENVELTQEEVGTLRVDHRTDTWGNSLRAWYEQDMLGPEGEPWLVTGRINIGYEADLPPLAVDGSYDSGVAFGLQGPADEWATPMYGCGRESSPNDSISVTFTGGYVDLQVEVVSVSAAGGVPSGFLRSAIGRLEGTTFVQTDYWNLAYVGGHHGWENDYFLLFDQPIGQFCGMWITDARYPEFSAVVRILDCDLSVIEER